MGGDGDVDRLLASIDRRVGQDLPAWPGGWPGQIEAALFDAVFSMQARYGGPTTGVRAVVARWRDHRGGALDDLAELAAADPEAVADIVRNRAKASRRLKAAIVVEAAGALASAGLIHAADFTGDPDQRRAYLSVRGCGPVTWTYFGMLPWRKRSQGRYLDRAVRPRRRRAVSDPDRSGGAGVGSRGRTKRARQPARPRDLAGGEVISTAVPLSSLDNPSALSGRRTGPDLRFVVPGWAENRWSDLLATLIATDPTPMGRVLGVLVDDVRREVAVAAAARKSDRLDLLLTRAEAAVAAIEVKVLSDLGVDQLTRYQAAFPNLEAYFVLHLASLPVNVQDADPWRSLAWEDALAAYADSDHPWVAATARAWLNQLGELVPHVDADTVWNDIPDKPADFELALRARVSWLTAQMHAWCTLPHDSVQSSGGGNWAVRMWHEATSPGHFVTAEMQEGMTAYEWRYDPTRPYRERLRGPVVLVGLREDGPDTSEGFDWRLLHRMFTEHVLDDTGQPADGRSWRTTSARPNHPIDKQNWLNIVDAGAPRWLGQGWGMKVARSNRSSLFGARFEIPATSTLRMIDTELRRTQTLLRAMASTL